MHVERSELAHKKTKLTQKINEIESYYFKRDFLLKKNIKIAKSYYQ